MNLRAFGYGIGAWGAGIVVGKHLTLLLDPPHVVGDWSALFMGVVVGAMFLILGARR